MAAPTAQTDATSATYKTRVADLNAAIAKAAARSYIAPANLNVTDLFSGTQGASFSGSDVMTYLNSKSALKTLKSAVFPSFDDNGTVTWKQFTYTASSANSGTFGSTPVQVIYNYNSSAASLSGSLQRQHLVLLIHLLKLMVKVLNSPL
ncbi:hypothetical protein GQR93_15060 (plasmid) [Lentilactobacillus hilgardii]|uniref:Uncharacterized protein n=1 Tax=Lentilactobacillus hilgardii TaxID=1588 RepID=A0A6P1EHW8_LENHI|nr:hypothetical protein [Lentilactobacillus hilgardii]QHB53564.1 hypothetical protein GQR93_15060 [Lentilactobacillus hilgardii]